MSIEEISEGLGLKEEVVETNLKRLITAYSEKASAFEIIKSGKKYSMQVLPELTERVRCFAQMEIPPKVLKTAALIAYHQPIKQSDLQDMFGSKIYDHVKVLDELGLIRKRQEGRTIVITTTSQFSEYFGIKASDKEKIKELLTEKVKKHKSKTKR